MKGHKIALLFYFYRYVQPAWYFNLKPNSSIPYWVDYRKINDEDKALIRYDQGYKSEDAQLRDAAYQAWQKGIMQKDTSVGLVEPFNRLPISDEYRFLRKYFHPLWTLYVLVVRILTFRNPFVEAAAFFNALRVARLDVLQVVKTSRAYDSFQSSIIKDSPLISVIIPTLNREAYLKDVLSDLAAQHYKNFDVIIVDQNDVLNEEFYSGWPFTLKVFHQKEKALWLARNTAIKESASEYLLFFDDDSRIEADWIEQHLKCLDFYQCQVSSGVSFSVVGANIPRTYGHFRWADQLDTGNVMIKKEVFRAIGLFDRQFEKQRMGDGEFGLRSFLAGFQSVSNPLAKRLHLKVGTGGLRQMGSWDGFRTSSWFAPRPIPSVLYLIRSYFGKTHAIFDLMIKVPPSLLAFRFKRNPLLLLIGLILLVFVFPLVFFQVVKSWKLSTKMLIEGQKIPKL